MAEIKKTKTRMYDPWGYQEENNYDSSENQFEIELNALFASAAYNDNDKKIHFFNNDGNEISGSSIDTSEFSSGVIESASYDKETKILTIVFSNGGIVEINLADLIDENEFADGLQVNDGIVSIKLDSATEAYLTVSESGLKLSGVDAAIKVEKTRAEKAEEILGSKIDAEEARATSAETAVNVRVDNLINELQPLLNDTLVTTNDKEAALGKYNVSNTSEDASGRTIFSIGNGTADDARSNALEVRENGDVYMWIEGDYMQINRLLAMLAHEVYDDDDDNSNG